MSSALVPDRGCALAPPALALAGARFPAGAGLSWGAGASSRCPPREATTRLFVLLGIPSPHFFTAPFPRALDNAGYVQELFIGVRNVRAILRKDVLGFADGTTAKRRIQVMLNAVVQARRTHEVLAQAEHHALTRAQADRAAERCIVVSAVHGRKRDG